MTSPDPPLPRSQPGATGSASARRLLLFAPNLSGGGAERTLARLATHWADQNRDVTLVTLAPRSPEDFPVSRKVRRVALAMTYDASGPLGGLRNNLARVRRLREEIRSYRPDVVVSFIEQANVLALLAARPLGTPVVVSERTDPSLHPVSRLWSFLRRHTYRRCAALVVLTDEIADAMRPIARGRPIEVIPNGVQPPSTARKPGSQIILGVGRLEQAKGFDRLIDAFAQIAERHPQWNLVLVGDGPQRAELERMVSSRSLQSRVQFAGRVDDPSTWYARADLFALPSRYEGFPNALLEAMAHGVPAVAFDGPAAVRQIIRHGTDGLLVSHHDVPAFAEALSTLVTDADRRTAMGEAARDVVTRFSLDAFFARWDAVIDAAASGASRSVESTGRERASAPRREGE
jgi:GalNAc-alpha-(1->4)-GalNAc-alpha-(1->3)-diNAcBac-PP-undecaprenol alpha-1,4-N-acetyl-D-galactosaminyltransferase